MNAAVLVDDTVPRVRVHARRAHVVCASRDRVDPSGATVGLERKHLDGLLPEGRAEEVLGSSNVLEVLLGRLPLEAHLAHAEAVASGVQRDAALRIAGPLPPGTQSTACAPAASPSGGARRRQTSGALATTVAR